MRKIAANYIFPVSRPPIKNGIIVVDDNGCILEVRDTGGKLREEPGLEFYNGVIVPGFVNSHSHLEYSYVKNLIPQGGGLVEFIKAIVNIKANVVAEERKMIEADEEMYFEGIVAVGDHSNTLAPKDIKKNSRIDYHSFVEIYTGLSDVVNPKADFEIAKAILASFEGKGSIVPHAPYTLTSEHFEIIAEYAHRNNAIISVHNQETESERDMFLYGKGTMYDFMVGDGQPPFEIGSPSLEWMLKFFKTNHNILLIHNTYTPEDDLVWAENENPNLYWVLCPGSNLYIENKLPDAPMFAKYGVKVALGTDSFASNTRLSILREMKILQDAYEIDFETLLLWATLNGAKALNKQYLYGSLDRGKCPGVLLLENFDIEHKKIGDQTRVMRII